MKHFTLAEKENVEEACRNACRNARRTVAVAKLSAFEIECETLGALAARYPHQKPHLVDCLHQIAFANNLTTTHGSNVIEGMISKGFAG